jgi:ferric-dicitrate binding protein FerR (iron transport regulator)
MALSIKDIIQNGASGKADPAERQQFLSLFHQPQLENEIKDHLLDELVKPADVEENKPYFDQLFENMWHQRSLEIDRSTNRLQWIIRLSQWAAILLFGLFAGYWINSGEKISKPVYCTSVAPLGSISEVILPDGSHIFLNSGSTLKYAVGDSLGDREIFLNGEAWFQVAKIKERPFLVHTSSYDIAVTGTTFNVKAYPEEREVVTTLVEGSVAVNRSGANTNESRTILKQGQQLVYDKESDKVSVEEVNTRMYTSWKDNKLVFVNMKLKDLKTLLERRYGVDIVIVDQNIMDYHYDGTFKNETILEVLDILKQTLPIEYRIEGQNIVIQKKRRNT